MEKEFDLMLQLFVAGAFGEKTKVPDDVDLNKVLQLAKGHNIYYSVLEALLQSDAKLTDEKREKGRALVKKVQLSSYYKHLRFAELFKVFEENDIPYALLKGYEVARHYKNPYVRVSGDTDVLINKADERKALSILKKQGFSLVELSTEDVKHSVLTHPELGVLELHVALYNKKTEKLWFEDDGISWEVNLSFRELKKIPFDDMYYYVLPANENISFVFEHVVKHFLYGGTSIRAFVDFFFAYTNEKIDYDWFYDSMCQKGYKTVFDAIITIVKRYAQKELCEIPYYEPCDMKLVDALLEDMKKGEWFGSAIGEEETAALANELSKRGKQANEDGAESILRKLFPEVRVLKNNYGYALKYPVLLPIAWCHRLFKYVFTRKKSKTVTEADKERLALLEKFGLI